ncbi:hypothetical protein M2347_002305 [Chryseobacterium sp. H1D6B]|uniref:hypothetical protein n=1 Tax=Chryseobacterium sp. H1D6B TaxID=2940588 RepID=UPI0015C6A018|nr:hypothetical protein [Chryseobacterium sp. H1D6B]MDH6252578.1 hypothetical protein [Chryseobacterium sp. H1D6B]
MKKIIKIWGIGLGLLSSAVYAQSSINFGDFPKPVPSVSSLAAYTNTPASNATGIPEISFPLVGLSSYNNGVNLSTGLSYNPMNVSESEPASQVGTGWSLFAGGVISRSIVDDIDELYDNTANNEYYKNAFDDIYYYNLPGISGKFKFVRDITSNTFKLVNLTSNRIKLDFTPSSNNATLIIDKFTITDTKGIQYIFNDYSRSNREQNIHLPGNKLYRSAFFLTQIKDANNVELANFSYQKDTKYKSNGISVFYETCKLKTITSPGSGKIEFEYLYNAALENSMNDPYQVQKVVLKDNYNHMISGYAFEYTAVNKRVLTKLKKLNKNNAVSETTEFEYGNAVGIGVPSYGTDPNLLCPGLYVGPPQIGMNEILKRVISPSGGVVEYNFEQNQMYIDRTAQNYLDTILSGNAFTDPEVQYINSFWGVDYDTHVSNNTNYTFTITGTASKRVFVLFVAEGLYTDSPVWDTSTPYIMGYTIKSGGAVVGGNPCQSPNYNGNYYVLDYTLPPGTYTVQVGGSGGKGGVYFYEIAHIPQPFKNSTRGIGVRIANMKYYNSRTDTAPVKTTKFEYNSFTDNNTSVGYSVLPDGDVNAAGYIIYKNVKVTNADDNNGYVKYYYKIPDDFPKQPYPVNGNNANFWPQYNMISSGLLDKKEVYDAQNKLLASELSSYTFEDVPDAEDYFVGGTASSRLGWMKKLVSTSKTYFDNSQSIEETAETNFNVFNFEVSSTKKIMDDTTVEQFFTYPETGYPKLALAYIKSLPVIVETKTDGELVSKTETKFDNSASTLPTSIITNNINNTASKTVTINQYDDKGNVLQFTSPAGISTAVVYGYDKTKPIAKIEGAAYAQVSSLMQSIVDASNADAADPSKEALLLTALDNFRKSDALKEYQITTYTYDPLIGATTVTPPSGIREIYQYDADNRLDKIVNMNGVTLKQYQYNYKH